jgi:hypothetical protein
MRKVKRIIIIRSVITVERVRRLIRMRRVKNSKKWGEIE